MRLKWLFLLGWNSLAVSRNKQQFIAVANKWNCNEIDYINRVRNAGNKAKKLLGDAETTPIKFFVGGRETAVARIKRASFLFASFSSAVQELLRTEWKRIDLINAFSTP